MKLILILFFSVIIDFTAFAQPGLYAGAAKKWVGKAFTDDNPDNIFKMYNYTGGYLLDESRQEFEVWVRQYKKGNTHLVVMYAMDTITRNNRVLDILEIKLPDAAANIQAGFCSSNGQTDMEIIAIERKGRILNGWRSLRDKLRFQKISKAGLAAVNCTVEGI